jgi:nucleoside-diphosphate-sugar epimerase
MAHIETVLVTGGGGYVGSALVPHLLENGYAVKVLDLFLYGQEVLDAVCAHPRFELLAGDIRDTELLRRSLPGMDAVIHLACISNDPSFELNRELGRSINFDAFEPLVRISRESGVKRFVYASSSSVYGIKHDANVTEDLPLDPLTDYSKYKALCESILLAERADGFTALVLRPATVCGYAPRLRLDLTVNILTSQAMNNRKITVFGGDQIRPNIHIQDMVDLYRRSLEWGDAAIDGKIYNAGYQNLKVRDIADTVKRVVADAVEIVTVPTDDNRSYHISSAKIHKELGFTPRHTVEQAVEDLAGQFKSGRLNDALTSDRYYNIKRMQNLSLR